MASHLFLYISKLRLHRPSPLFLFPLLRSCLSPLLPSSFHPTPRQCMSMREERRRGGDGKRTFPPLRYYALPPRVCPTKVAFRPLRMMAVPPPPHHQKKDVFFGGRGPVYCFPKEWEGKFPCAAWPADPWAEWEWTYPPTHPGRTRSQNPYCIAHVMFLDTSPEKKIPATVYG